MFGYVSFLIDQLQYKISTIFESTREKGRKPSSSKKFYARSGSSSGVLKTRLSIDLVKQYIVQFVGVSNFS